MTLKAKKVKREYQLLSLMVLRNLVLYSHLKLASVRYKRTPKLRVRTQKMM